VLWGLHIGLPRLSDNSFLTHLATGRLILASGSVPSVDPYSFTAAGEPWVVQSWLASVIYAGTESLVGLQGLRLFVGFLTAALVALMWRLTRPVEGLVARFAIAASAVAVGAVTWSERPLMFGLVLLAATVLVTERGLRPFWLVPIFWIWVNTHGSFPLGLVLLGAMALGSWMDRELPRAELRMLLWAVGGVFAGLVNPIGPGLLTFPSRVLDRQEVFRNIVEWRSPDFSTAVGRLFLVQVILAVVLLMLAPRWRFAVPLLVFVALSLVAQRNIAVTSIALLPGMASGAKTLGSPMGAKRTVRTAMAALFVVVLAGASITGALRQGPLDLASYPVDAMAWMERTDVLPDEPRIIAPDVVGNYLELLYGPEANVFIDDRVDMFPKGIVEDAVTLLRGRPAMSEVLERWQPDAVLWSREDPFVPVILGDPRWRLVYADESWVVVLPRPSASAGR
jgi:hypothetical protein